MSIINYRFTINYYCKTITQIPGSDPITSGNFYAYRLFSATYRRISTAYRKGIYIYFRYRIMTTTGGGQVKIRVEIDPEAPEEEIVLRCRELTPEVVKLQQLLAKQIKSTGQIILYQNDTEYYLETDRILFFETEGSQVLAHTETEIFEARKKLYELEDMLGSDFLRISKSAIVNLNRIYAIRRNLAASSEISFQGTHKQIYVSRAYIKVLKERLEEKRLER